MRKFTILLSLVLFAGVVFGQYQSKEIQKRKDVPSFEKKQNIDYSELTKSAVWANDFSNAADWTIGETSPDGAEWVVCTYATAPEDFLPVYGMNGTFVSATVDNGFALFNSDIQGSDEDSDLQDAWIQFANPIDLSGVSVPRIIFTTYYRNYADIVYFEYSTDGGTTWGNKELFTDLGSPTAVDQMVFVNVPEVGNEASVLIRFRFTGDWDYGVFIDDLSIVDAPSYDLQLLETATNFFVVYDYATEGSGYHYSSHNGMVPYDVITNENAYIVFNAIVKNNGTENATPEVTVKITDPNAVEVYNFVFTSDIELAPDQVDTLDIAWNVGEEFYITAEDWVLGQYSIDFDLAVVGQEDGTMTNNSFSTYFMTTDNVYAKDGDNLDGVTGPGLWLDGGEDGDMFGVNYLVYETTTIDSVQAYIVSNSTPGTSLMCHIMMYDSGSAAWVAFAASSIEIIEESDLGTWFTFTFTDPAIATSPDGTSAFEFKVVLEFYYGGETLWIGEDNTVPSSLYSTSWKFAGDEDWTYITNYLDACPMIRACFPVVGVSANQTVAANVNIYPNPTTGIVNVNNVEGARIEVLNMVGQTIATVENASAINNIDLSKEANGTYFVRVVNGNEVSTTKINLVK